MLNILNTPQGIEALRELGVNIPNDFDQIQRLPFPQAKQMLNDLKERVKKSFRKIAPELHPDKTGGDSVKTEKFKLLVQVQQAFEKIDIQPRMPAPPPMVIYQAAVNFADFSTTASTTTSFHCSPFAGGTVNGPTAVWRVVRMKPF